MAGPVSYDAEIKRIEVESAERVKIDAKLQEELTKRANVDLDNKKNRRETVVMWGAGLGVLIFLLAVIGGIFYNVRGSGERDHLELLAKQQAYTACVASQKTAIECALSLNMPIGTGSTT